MLLKLLAKITMRVKAYHNATADDRYSLVDKVDSDEETDPLNEKYSHKVDRGNKSDSIQGTSVAYCPYCGKPVEGDFDFCPIPLNRGSRYNLVLCLMINCGS